MIAPFRLWKRPTPPAVALSIIAHGQCAESGISRDLTRYVGPDLTTSMINRSWKVNLFVSRMALDWPTRVSRATRFLLLTTFQFLLEFFVTFVSSLELPDNFLRRIRLFLVTQTIETVLFLIHFSDRVLSQSWRNCSSFDWFKLINVFKEIEKNIG